MSADPLIGEIFLFAGNFAPRGFAFCDGQLLPIAQNSALFSLLGTVYGGDGRTSFGLPDLRGRTPIHAGNGPGLSPRTLGQKIGAETITLTVANLPSHNHLMRVVDSEGNALSPVNAYLAESLEEDASYSNASPNADLNSGAIANTGGGQSFSIIQPSLAVNYIIALVGVYPSRN